MCMRIRTSRGDEIANLGEVVVVEVAVRLVPTHHGHIPTGAAVLDAATKLGRVLRSTEYRARNHLEYDCMGCICNAGEDGSVRVCASPLQL